VTDSHPDKDTAASTIYRHVAGNLLGCAIGAALFASAHKLKPDIMRGMFDTSKQAAVTGGVLTGIVSVGSGRYLYDMTLGKLHNHEGTSFASRISAERAAAAKERISR